MLHVQYAEQLYKMGLLQPAFFVLMHIDDPFWYLFKTRNGFFAAAENMLDGFFFEVD